MIDEEEQTIMQDEQTFCFKCGDITYPVEEHPNKTLGLCPCYEGWYVGTRLQMCDFLNEASNRLEELGAKPEWLEDYRIDTDEEYDDNNLD